MKEKPITEFPQQSIDLMAWQYAQGALDTCIKLGQLTAVGLINDMIKTKMARIKQFYNDRRPSHNLVAVISKNGMEITKVEWKD